MYPQVPIAARMEECRLELHPEKTKVVYFSPGGRRIGSASTSSTSAQPFRPGGEVDPRGDSKLGSACASVTSLSKICRGWLQYYGRYYRSALYPTGMYWEIDWFVQRRSQRPYHPPKGEAWHTHLQRLGLVCLARPSESGSVHACGESFQQSRTREIRICGSTRVG
jgi:hypothetical protein